MSDKPKSKRDWALHRCKLSCRVGRDYIHGANTPQQGFTVTECALFNLLHAVEDLATAMETKTRRRTSEGHHRVHPA